MQTAQRNSLRLLQWMMVASLALPLMLFVFASAVSWVSIQQTADREIERTLDVAHEHALKVFETIDRSLSEIAEVIRGIPDEGIASREETLHLRLKQVAGSLPQVKSAWIFDAKGPCAGQQPGGACARLSIFRTGIISSCSRVR